MINNNNTLFRLSDLKKGCYHSLFLSSLTHVTVKLYCHAVAPFDVALDRPCLQHFLSKTGICSTALETCAVGLVYMEKVSIFRWIS